MQGGTSSTRGSGCMTIAFLGRHFMVSVSMMYFPRACS